jgi:hypothetical protein
MNIRFGDRRRWAVIAFFRAAGVCALFLWPNDSGIQKAVEKTRQSLRQQGFKTDLAEFNFSSPPEARRFENALTAFSRTQLGQRFVTPDLLTGAGSNAAVVIWQQDWMEVRSQAISLSELAGETEAKRSELDAACDAALSGPIRFNLDASRGRGMLLPHLAPMKSLAEMLAIRTLLDLRDNNKDAAWTNLLALTRLVTAWQPEPVVISRLVQFEFVTIICDGTWQALQARDWSDDRLARLQQEWESMEFLTNLPETAAFDRASAVDLCRRERKESGALVPTLAAVMKEALRSPPSAWMSLKSYYGRLQYLHHGTYADEQALLLFYRDRELELRNAVQAGSWSAMRVLPGVTNPPRFTSPYQSQLQANLKMGGFAATMAGRPGGGWLARAAEAEARRQLMVTAIALERYRGRHKSYPKSLRELAPEYLKEPPMDFMDGQPLRYRLTDDGHFVLYSIDLDGIDHGGQWQQQKRMRMRFSGTRNYFLPQQAADLIWPRPASAAEVESLREEEQTAASSTRDSTEEMATATQWLNTQMRQAQVETILAAKPAAATTEPVIRGRPLHEILRNPDSSGTNQLSLAQMLTLKQVITGAEPDTVTFEAPIRYDAMTNLGYLKLYVDPCGEFGEYMTSDQGCVAEEIECNRATNGDCLLVWRTIYESPGKHALQMGLALNGLTGSPLNTIGPFTTCVVSNLCQVSVTSRQFDPLGGATIRFKLPESNGVCAVDFLTTGGRRLKTISADTSNGFAKVHWDLTDEHGQRLRDREFDTVLHITLTDSGKSQTLKGP